MKLSDIRTAVRVVAQRAASLFRASAPRLTTETLLSDRASLSVIEQFHRLWYVSSDTASLRWLGNDIVKNPLDLWIYQEILWSRRPDVLVETGTHRGGSALFFSDIARLGGFGLDVVTVDFNPKIEYETGSRRIHSVVGISTTERTFGKVQRLLEGFGRKKGRPLSIMVVLDSDHTMENVVKELALYGTLVTPGQALVVEDTNVNGHPVLPGFGPGPFEAVEEFLREHPEFVRDQSCERLLLTMHPGGWLRRLE